jgi:hypothetical protein
MLKGLEQSGLDRPLFYTKLKIGKIVSNGRKAVRFRVVVIVKQQYKCHIELRSFFAQQNYFSYFL